MVRGVVSLYRLLLGVCTITIVAVLLALNGWRGLLRKVRQSFVLWHGRASVVRPWCLSVKVLRHGRGGAASRAARGTTTKCHALAGWTATTRLTTTTVSGGIIGFAASEAVHAKVGRQEGEAAAVATTFIWRIRVLAKELEAAATAVGGRPSSAVFMIAHGVLHANRRVSAISLLSWCAGFCCLLRLSAGVCATKHTICDATESRAALVAALVRLW